MTALDLKAFHNRTIRINFEDGEIATAHLSCSSDECDEVMVDILATNRPDRYPQIDTCTYIVYAAEIASVMEISPMPAESEAHSRTLHLVEEPAAEENVRHESLAA